MEGEKNREESKTTKSIDQSFPVRESEESVRRTAVRVKKKHFNEMANYIWIATILSAGVVCECLRLFWCNNHDGDGKNQFPRYFQGLDSRLKPVSAKLLP
jgi:hypothetical protein